MALACSLVILGDAHDATDRLEGALALVADVSPALVLLTGDLTRDPARKHVPSVERILTRVAGAFPRAMVAWVPGNHDLREPPVTLPAELRERVVNVDCAVHELGGLRVAGTGGAGPARFGFPYEWGEQQARERIAATLGSDGADIWLCHTPPQGGALDVTRGGEHVGSRAVADALEGGLVADPCALFVCGHIHEADGVEVRRGTPCINAGALGNPYPRTLAYVVVWDVLGAGPTTIERRELIGGAPVREQRWARR